MKLRHKVELPNQEYLVRRRRLRRKVSKDETVQRQQVWEGTGPGWRFADFAAGFEAQNLNPKPEAIPNPTLQHTKVQEPFPSKDHATQEAGFAAECFFRVQALVCRAGLWVRG